MGKKARNAGKKSSKTCDKPATAKSMHCKKGEINWIKKTHNLVLDNKTCLFSDDEMSEMLNDLSTTNYRGRQTKPCFGNTLHDNRHVYRKSIDPLPLLSNTETIVNLINELKKK
jgi:hypothetical protein|tara:strand:+ start:120 stop:461 length:342 start_codon:yes stop_codon:yes gene_type:complete